MSQTRELTFKDCVEKYPDVPKFIVLKLDAQRRGVTFTDRALEAAQDPKYQHAGPAIYGRAETIQKRYPGPLILRDGTSIITSYGGGGESEIQPYSIDLLDSKFMIVDEGESVEEVDFCPRPDFYGKKTSRGVPMENIMSTRPQRLEINPYGYCHFWDDGNQCQFCSVVSDLTDQIKGKTGRKPKVKPEDLYETVREAIKEPGRYSQINMTGGSDPRGDQPFDTEVNRYIKTLQAIGKNFKSRRFPSQLIASAFSKDQLVRLYEETGLATLCVDIEVWDERLFKWICPGKEKWIGRQGWIDSLLNAVEIFGWGNVYTNFVAGCEMAEPHGFKSMDEALKSNFEGCEFFAKQGISMLSIVWRPGAGSCFEGQKQPPLEYYVRLVQGLHEIKQAHGLTVDNDDFKHCGNHGDSDLNRLD
jgi:hypothetical protein